MTSVKHFLAKKSHKSLLYPTPRGISWASSYWINSKFGMEMFEMCGDVIEGFKDFELLSVENQGVTKSKKSQKYPP